MSRRRILIDCDPGTDDAIALLFAFASPELDVALITVVGGNVGLAHTLRNARALVGLAGASTPVVGGADRPLMGAFVAEPRVHGADGIGGVVLPDGSPARPGLAADAIRAALRAAGPDGLTLVGIGPATNLALALATEPALAANIAEIVLMTGAWAEGNVTPVAEFNAWNDPEALAIVLACGRPITLATLELTAQALCTPGWLVELQARGAPQASGQPQAPGQPQAGAKLACLRAAHAIAASIPPSRRLGGRGAPQHDLCAVAWLAAPELFTHRPGHAMVDCGAGPGRGQTIIDRWQRTGAAANVRLLETVDAASLFALLADRLATLP